MCSTVEVPVGGRVVEPARRPRELGGEHQPDRDRGAVPPPVPLPLLDGVRESVPVVEDLAQLGLPQVGGDDLGLDGDGPADQLGERGAGRVDARRCRSASMIVRIAGSAMNPHLTTSAMPATSSCGGRRLQRGEVGDHRGRLVERADHVLAGVGVDAGLAADRGVDHAEQRGRHLDDRDPAHPGGGGEAGDVGDRPAAQPDHHVAPVQADLAEHVPAESQHVQVLRVLGVRDLQQVRLAAGVGDGRPGSPRPSRARVGGWISAARVAPVAAHGGQQLVEQPAADHARRTARRRRRARSPDRAHRITAGTRVETGGRTVRRPRGTLTRGPASRR